MVGHDAGARELLHEQVQSGSSVPTAASRSTTPSSASSCTTDRHASFGAPAQGIAARTPPTVRSRRGRTDDRRAAIADWRWTLRDWRVCTASVAMNRKRAWTERALWTPPLGRCLANIALAIMLAIVALIPLRRARSADRRGTSGTGAPWGGARDRASRRDRASLVAVRTRASPGGDTMRATRLWNYAFAPTLRTVEPAAFLHDGGLWGCSPFTTRERGASQVRPPPHAVLPAVRHSTAIPPSTSTCAMRAAHSVAVKSD